jgi:hypothetical protein
MDIVGAETPAFRPGEKRRSFLIAIAVSSLEWLTIPHVDPLDRAAGHLQIA